MFLVTVTTSLGRGRAGCWSSIGNTVPNEAGVSYLRDESNFPDTTTIPWCLPDMGNSLPLCEAHLNGGHAYWVFSTEEKVDPTATLFKIERNQADRLAKSFLFSKCFWYNQNNSSYNSFILKIILNLLALKIQSSQLPKTGRKKKEKYMKKSIMLFIVL